MSDSSASSSTALQPSPPDKADASGTPDESPTAPDGSKTPDEPPPAEPATKQDKDATPPPPAEPTPPPAPEPAPEPAPPPSTAPAPAPAPDPLLDERSTGTEAYLHAPVTLEEFRTLIGVPADLPLGSAFPRWWANVRATTTNDPEQNLGIYRTILREEKRTMARHDLYNALIYCSLVVQLVVSALLILLAALPQEHHITLAVLGAANGVIAGILGLVRGQGLPGRLLQYADGLRKVRETIEWLEKELVAGKRPVSYREIVRLREMYQQIRGDEHQNRPDSWVSGLQGHTGSSGPGASH